MIKRVHLLHLFLVKWSEKQQKERCFVDLWSFTFCSAVSDSIFSRSVSVGSSPEFGPFKVLLRKYQVISITRKAQTTGRTFWQTRKCIIGNLWPIDAIIDNDVGNKQTGKKNRKKNSQTQRTPLDQPRFWVAGKTREGLLAALSHPTR